MEILEQAPVVGVSVVSTTQQAAAVQAAQQAVEQSQSNTTFGLDFPSLFNPPSVAEQASINDPVSSGGDPAGFGPTRTENDEEE